MDRQTLMNDIRLVLGEKTSREKDAVLLRCLYALESEAPAVAPARKRRSDAGVPRGAAQQSLTGLPDEDQK